MPLRKISSNNLAGRSRVCRFSTPSDNGSDDQDRALSGPRILSEWHAVRSNFVVPKQPLNTAKEVQRTIPSSSAAYCPARAKEPSTIDLPASRKSRTNRDSAFSSGEFDNRIDKKPSRQLGSGEQGLSQWVPCSRDFINRSSIGESFRRVPPLSSGVHERGQTPCALLGGP